MYRRSCLSYWFSSVAADLVTKSGIRRTLSLPRFSFAYGSLTRFFGCACNGASCDIGLLQWYKLSSCNNLNATITLDVPSQPLLEDEVALLACPVGFQPISVHTVMFSWLNVSLRITSAGQRLESVAHSSISKLPVDKTKLKFASTQFQ